MNTRIDTWIYRINVIVFLLLILSLFGFFPDRELRVFRIAESLLLLSSIFILPAINLTAVLGIITRRCFDLAESLGLACVIAVLFVPLALSIETEIFLNTLFRVLPIINAAISFLLLTFLSNHQTKTIEHAIPLSHQAIRVFPAFIISSLILVASVFAIITTYYPLPDIDPYYWVSTFQNQFSQGIITPLVSYRPLFSSLTYLFNQTANVDLYAFFKYFLPFFSLLPILPALILAQRIRSIAGQMIVFLLPIANASFFLYSTLSVPQAIFNSLFIIALIFAIHSLLSRHSFFFYVSGTILLIGSFYHEMSAIPLIAWITAWIIFEWKTLRYFATKNKLITLLLTIIVISHLPSVIPLTAFVSHWIMSISHAMGVSHPNFSFPAEYTNVDGNAVGWQDAAGVIKYYAFYFGPAAFASACLLLIIAWHKGPLRFVRKKESVFLLFSLIFFLSISDVLPRLFSIALLPERALTFASLLFVAAIPLLIIRSQEHHRPTPIIIPIIIIAGLITNLGAALYINSLKKYLITPEQLTSAQWIQDHLPENRVILTVGNDRLLRFYSGSDISSFSDPAFYSDLNTFETSIKKHKTKRIELFKSAQQQLADSSENIRRLTVQYPDTIDFIQPIEQELARLERIKATLKDADQNKIDAPETKYYIYYAAPDKRNPYADRPYISAFPDEPNRFIFDIYPDRFHMIYSDTENKIYLWEVL